MSQLQQPKNSIYTASSFKKLAVKTAFFSNLAKAIYLKTPLEIPVVFFYV